MIATLMMRMLAMMMAISIAMGTTMTMAMAMATIMRLYGVHHDYYDYCNDHDDDDEMPTHDEVVWRILWPCTMITIVMILI